MSLPPIAAYNAWLEAQDGRANGRGRMSASTFRRMAQLRREGQNFAEIARCIGWKHEGVRKAWERLPEDLR